MNTEEIKKLIPEDFEKHCDRDISVFSSSVFGDTYVKTLKEMFDLKFSIVFFVVKNRNCATFYRSKKEHDRLREIIGKKARDKKFAFFMAKNLREHTDWINKFIAENKAIDLFLSKKREFVENYKIFFAYHQIVYWGADYLSENNPELKDILKEFNDAYAYNERVVPDVENYLAKLGIDHLNYKNDSGEIKDIGMFFSLDKEIDVFSNDLNVIENFIKKKNVIDKGIKEFKGIGIYGDKLSGKVKVVKDLSKQRDIEEGLILVTGMNRPQFNDTIMKCKAIITDEGGMVCHASILAREVGIPCIVGTKIATEVLNDDDWVYLDIKKGIVRKLEK